MESGMRRKRGEATIGCLSKTVFKCAMCFVMALLAGFSASVRAQSDAANYPSRPIRVVVPYPPGGGVDILARILAEKVPARWGQPITVENRAGAGGNVGTESVVRATPDGYTMLFSAHPPLVVNKSLYRKLAYDPDVLTPVALMVNAYSLLLVHPKVPVRSLQEFITYARSNPGKLNFSSQGVGNAAHLSAELFNILAGVKMVHVPYKGGGPAFAGLVAGDVEVMFGELSVAVPFIRGGKLLALGYGGTKRHPEWQDVPAISETLPRFLAMTWQGMVAPPGTPTPIVGKWAAAINDVIKLPDIAIRLREMGFFPMGGGPQEMAQFMKEERERWAEVIRVSGAREE